MMFKKFFAKEEDEEVYETIDPVLERRRKEKFSTPLIYNDEEEEEKEQNIKKVEPKKEIKLETTYRMSEIISPMTGLKQSFDQPKTTVQKPKKKKVQNNNDELIPIISPFYGNLEKEEPVEEKIEGKIQKVKQVQDEPSIEQNLRNIASIVEEEQDQLKIIEERTGEFKLDLKNKEDSLIDEIDDSMSLDELMSLYEKKFKD